MLQGAQVGVPSRTVPYAASAFAGQLDWHSAMQYCDCCSLQPWMQPMLLALEGTRKHLLSEHLRADLTLTLRADTESEEGHELLVHLAGPTSLFDEAGQPAACCFTFKHEINLLDFVEDLADLFSALTTKLAAQTPYVSIVP